MAINRCTNYQKPDKLALIQAESERRRAYAEGFAAGYQLACYAETPGVMPSKPEMVERVREWAKEKHDGKHSEPPH